MRLSELRTLVAARPVSLPWPRVVCVWLPQLPLRVEVLRRPIWDGRPLVLGGAPGERKVVQLCSPEAQRAGIRPGLPLREVLAVCPDAIVLQPDPVCVAAVLDEVLAALQGVSPAVEPTEERMFLDLRGLEALYASGGTGRWGDGPTGRRGDEGTGPIPALERAIRAAVPPLLRPRIGIANGKFAASAAARVVPPSGARVVPAAETAAFLAPLPIGSLPFDPDVLQRMDMLGLRTIGDLAGLPFSAVQAEFGPAGARAWRLANGRDDEPVIPSSYKPTVQASVRCDDPLASVEAVMAALEQLLARVFTDPAVRGRSVRQVRLRALLVDGASWERLFTFKEALSSREAARRALKSKLGLPNGLPPAPIEELYLELIGFGGEAAKQLSLFVARARQLGQIAEAARQLRARYGYLPLHHTVEVEPWSRIPERRWALVTCDL
jgi:nucleotidyltransferase/DNA polymerase involved in DNA repair